MEIRLYIPALYDSESRIRSTLSAYSSFREAQWLVDRLNNSEVKAQGTWGVYEVRMGETAAEEVASKFLAGLPKMTFEEIKSAARNPDHRDVIFRDGCDWKAAYPGPEGRGIEVDTVDAPGPDDYAVMLVD